MGTAHALAKGTASVELVGGAERASTMKPEALEPGMYGEAGREVETSVQELDALLRKSEHRVDAPPQGSLKEGKHESGHKSFRGKTYNPQRLEGRRTKRSSKKVAGLGQPQPANGLAAFQEVTNAWHDQRCENPEGTLT